MQNSTHSTTSIIIIIFITLPMFKNMLGKVLQGLSNFSPVKNLIKYIIDRSLNELLSDQISLEDFKNGELFLTKLSLNLEKINKEYLLSSPYILHKGEVRRLKITLPSWSDLSTKSIEITAEGLHIDLKPNKQFVDNFKQAMRENHSDISQPQQPGGIDNPMDFFRQLVKQIILNMKIRVENSVIRLFINQPTKEVTAKPQYYLMFRLPLLSIGKNEDLIATGKSQEVEEIKFDFIIPQMSLHLLKENADFPEYLNEKAVKEDFPFTYPPVSHPSTILLIGQTKNLGSVDREKSTKLTITLTTFFKKQRKAVNIQGKINNFQATIDPIQLKIICRFFAQLMQFQKILKSVMAQMGLNPQAPTNLNLSRRDSKGKSGNYDLFSSIMVSISQPSKPIPSAQINIYNNMMQSPEMQKAATEFNQKAVMQLRSSGDFQEGWKNITFKQEMTMRFQLRLLQANILKYVSASAYQRKWSAQEGYQRVNESLGCSHYRLVTLGLQYNFSSTKNQHEVKVRVVKLQDARLKNSLSFHQSVSQEFYDLDSSTFQNINVNQNYFTKQPELFPFRLYKEQHYCLQELFQLSQGQDKQHLSDRVKTYAFMPAGGQCGEGAGLSINFNGHSKALIIVIKDVAVMANFEIWKDVLNMIYPVFLYRKLYERMNLQTPELNIQENGVPKNFNMFESQYPIGGRLLEESESKQQKVQVRVKVGLVYCFYRETAGLKTKQNLFQEVEKKILDSDNFSKQCFCGLNQKGIYAEIRGLQWQQMQEEFNLSIAEVKAGLLSVVNSKTEEDVKPILIGENLRVEEIKVEKKEGKMIETILKNRTYLPKVRFVVELPALISFIDMTKKVVAVVDSLQNFKKTLASKLLIIQQQLSNRSRMGKDKVQKQRIVECFVGEVELKMLLISTYLRGVFFRKRGGEQQLKLCSIAAGLAKHQDVRIGQYKNQLITGQYPLTQSYAGIRDTNLIIEIGRGCNKKSWGGVPSQPKNIRRLQRKLEFFQAIEKEQMNLWIIIREKTQSGQQKKQSREFKFDKARKNSVIQQQKKVKDITILPMQVYIHAGNLAFLLLHKKQLQDIFNQVGLVMREIQEESRDIMERRGSIQSQNEVTTQLSVNLKDLRLNIDIKPDYSYNANSGQRILSNTRMFITLELPLKISANPDSKIAAIDLNLNLSCHFLHYLDKDIETNPLLLNSTSLAGLGFRKIFQLTGMAIKADLNGKSQTHQLECTIDSLKADLCLSTIPYLRLFMDHFTQHSLAGNYGSDEDSNFIILDNDPNEDFPEDITEKLEEYERLLEEKKRVFNEFATRPFQVRQAQGPRFNLKKLIVNVVRVKLYGGNQFKFVECNSQNQSRACLRNRSENPDLFNFLSLTIENIRTRAMKGEKQLQMLQELDRLQLQLSFKRREGLMWGMEKDYTTHLLKINSPIKILIELNKEYSKFKLNTLEMTASLTDEVFSLAEQFQKAANACEKSAWKRHYPVEKVVESGRKMLLAILPEGRITASAQFKRAKLLNERVLRLQELVIHEQSSNGERISKLFGDWAMTIFTSNLGTLVSGALFEVLSTCIGLLLGAVKQILAIFFPRLKD